MIYGGKTLPLNGLLQRYLNTAIMCAISGIQYSEAVPFANQQAIMNKQFCYVAFDLASYSDFDTWGGGGGRGHRSILWQPQDAYLISNMSILLLSIAL